MITSKFRQDISQWGKIQRTAWENFFLQIWIGNIVLGKFSLLLNINVRRILVHIIGHWRNFARFVGGATCKTREVATLLWNLSRRRCAFLGPENTFLVPGSTFLGLENTFYGTWKYLFVFSFFSHEKNLLLDMHLFVGKYCIFAFQLRGGAKISSWGVQKLCSERPTPW